MKKLSSNKGFTLVELIIVIAILAIIMLIAIPNVPKIIQRNKVRTDMIAAQEIGKFVRSWHSDYSTDPLKSKTMTIIPTIKDGKVTPIPYKAIVGIDTYVEQKYVPDSLLDEYGVAEANQEFAVFFDGSGSVPRVVVAIVPFEEETTGEGAEAVTTYETDEIVLDELDMDALAVNYDGYPHSTDHPTSGPIAYME